MCGLVGVDVVSLEEVCHGKEAFKVSAAQVKPSVALFLTAAY